ncbi:hypothetical protein Xoosp13_325 [Xanthomonas phage Xoo-sp13]|nr:hypothetical protein Xoosp13_325 [Xanthomonas phage Xoo-sp13]
MDTIDVVLDKSPDGNPYYHNIHLIINNEKVNGVFDVIRFITSFIAFKKVDTELLTCSCGNAGCAGIFYGTTIKIRKHSVEWRDIDCGFSKKFYSFNIHQYKSVVRKAYQLVYNIALDTSNYNKEDDGDYYNPFYPTSINGLDRSMNYYTGTRYVDVCVKYYNAIALSPDKIKERKQKCVL